MKDNFSAQAAQYALYRPEYPEALYAFLLQHVPARRAAWDCATGSGQAAAELSKHFGVVHATDLSAAMLAQAPALPNVRYAVCPAEQSALADDSVDLITVAQAYHWFRFDAFMAEARRVLRPGGLLAVWGYNLPTITPAVDERLQHFYTHIVGPYWDAERRYVDERYRTVPFGVATEIPCPAFDHATQWTLPQLLGYQDSWSATQHYIRARSTNPVQAFAPELQRVWGDAERLPVWFPIFMRAGRFV
jgi:SAM-dependent methyltransferase